LDNELSADDITEDEVLAFDDSVEDLNLENLDDDDENEGILGDEDD